MKLTRRGWTAVLVFALTLILGWRFGARSLNAVAAPLLAALLVGALSVSRAEPPAVTLSDPQSGFQEDTRQLTVAVEGTGLATITVTLPDGIDTDRLATTAMLPHTLEQRLRLVERGIHTLGPVSVEYRGPLGLVHRGFDAAETADIVVYPRRHELAGTSPLLNQFGGSLSDGEGTFDQLREYQSGDPFRRIHWKSSAKRDELLVRSHSHADREGEVLVAATADPDCGDAMATAALSVTEALLDAGLSVGLLVPSTHVEAGRGSDHRERLRTTLATANSGFVSGADEMAADIVIHATYSETTVRTARRSATFRTLLSSTGHASPPEVTA